jgi:hypothetical protein
MGDKELSQFKRLIKTDDRSDATATATESSQIPSRVFDRLYASSKLTATELQTARLAYAASQLAECSFQPSTERSKRSAQLMGLRAVDGSSPEGTALPDTFSRLYKDAAERNLKKIKAVEVAQGTEACPFSPEISEVSRRITESMRDATAGDLPRHVLLYEDGLQRQQVGFVLSEHDPLFFTHVLSLILLVQARNSAEANLEREVTDDDLRNCTFQPLVAHLPVRQIATANVHDRLYENARQKQAVLAAATLGVPLEQYPSFAGGDVDEEADDIAADEDEEERANAAEAIHTEGKQPGGSMYLI